MGIVITNGGVNITSGQIKVTSYTPPSYTLWVWGVNNYGKLGIETSGLGNSQSSPVQIGASSDWTKISVGGGATLAIKVDKSLWAWGFNGLGSVGDGTIIDRSSPIQIGSLNDWADVNGGQYHSHALKTDGSLWAWGRNTAGNGGSVGDGTIIDRSSPIQIGSLTNWVKLGTRGSSPHAIKTDGSLWAWGSGGSGAVGDGTAIDRSSPVQIGALTDWFLVDSSNNSQTFAIKTDGSLWAWGNNFGGRLGLGDSGNNRSSPVQIGLLTNWVSVSSSHGGHTHAIKTDGSLWAWGNNSDGQLAQGDIIDRSSPVQIGALTDWASANANLGSTNSNALKTDGTLWSWGDNAPFGRLGLGDIIDRSSPVQIGALTTWTSISNGLSHSAALKPA